MHDCFDVLLSHAGTIPRHLLASELTGFGKPTLRDQIAHVLTNELAWVRGLQSLPIQRVEAAALSTVEAAVGEQKRIAQATIKYLHELGEQELNTEFHGRMEEWPGPPRSPAFILLHVVTHFFHHKGQIVAMMRLLGYPAPDTDMQRG